MRYHPMSIAFRIYQFIKNSIFIILLLFLLRRESEFWLFEYGRYAFIGIFILRVIYLIVAWFIEKYEWKDRAFHIQKGVFVKHASTVPFSRIQNVTRKTTAFHKLLGLTSLTFETARDGQDDAIHFEVLTKKDADFLIDLVQPGKQEEQSFVALESDSIDTEMKVDKEPNNETERLERTVVFNPERKDLWKASFTSLSFLAIIPIVFGAIEYVQPFLPEADEVEGLLQLVLHSKWLIAVIIMLAVLIAVGFGVGRTFIRYGKYEISASKTHIYIDRGVLNESFFAIEKRRIQGLEMEQTFLKRIFGLAEVKLISSANPNQPEGGVNVNSLYPFLPINQAYKLIETVLPEYNLNIELKRLPRKSLLVKLLRPSWLWIIATVLLVYFKPDILNLEQAWWMVSLLLLLIIIIQRVLDYIHTRYAISLDQVQWWQGGLTSRMFVTKRKNIIEMKYSQTRLQKYFEVSSITTMNRSNPPHVESITDIPTPFALEMKDWYFKRTEDVELNS
ncbi:PH domain-containing protein [Ornithinibacillus scapharcae]|uniref:PH domain-containing protein n=1 Tax=Ornithinibacillus scapharcae TaxID=1147159 RepID=UPI000225B7BF|nr:PH domain-containing protein [Ornithinibacillus scapharcae]